VIVILLIAFFLGIYFSRLSPVSNPNNQTPTNPQFDYSLSVSETNVTLIQGNTLWINLTATYLEGQPENISFYLSGLPQQANYSFNPPKGVPSNSTSFNSTLQIQITEQVPSAYYNLTITSQANNSKTHAAQSAHYYLAVLNDKISVSGKVTTNNKTPTKVVFEQLSSPYGSLTGKIYSSTIISGNYSVELPNKTYFALSVDYTRPDGTSGTHHFILPFSTDAAVGVNSITWPFGWETSG
jgi:hypothetical protein